MKHYRKELWFDVPGRRAFINITPDVEEAIRESGIKDGFVLCNAMHITASVFINDDESGLHHDYEKWLEKLAPHEPVSQYRHNVGEDNADAHMKRQIMGREVVVAITDGRLDFGTWERHAESFQIPFRTAVRFRTFAVCPGRRQGANRRGDSRGSPEYSSVGPPRRRVPATRPRGPAPGPRSRRAPTRAWTGRALMPGRQRRPG